MGFKEAPSPKPALLPIVESQNSSSVTRLSNTCATSYLESGYIYIHEYNIKLENDTQ